MHERVDVDHFNGGARGVEGVERRLCQGACGLAQQRADALSAAERGIAQRLVQAHGQGVGGWDAQGERMLGAVDRIAHPLLEGADRFDARRQEGACVVLPRDVVVHFGLPEGRWAATAKACRVSVRIGTVKLRSAAQ
ncbi:hypothetical protein D9M68_925580 [compost metagenome]